MDPEEHIISVKGKPVAVPCLRCGNLTVVATGRFVRVAIVHDEEWLEPATVGEPASVLRLLKEGRLKADIFSFAQRIPDTQPRFPFAFEWDNAAVIPTASYQDWWGKLSQESRRNVRMATKKGVTVRVVPFDDELVKGIASIYNETPVRLGKRFWHYGKDLETVRRENRTYLERSEWIGAFHEGKLIGFMKVVFVDRIGSIMQILSWLEHRDKRVPNALIAKGVEVCEARGMSYLMYCKYTYGDSAGSPLTEFKRRNGFEQVEFPRYYVPLTSWGRLAMKLRAHHGLRGMLPPALLGCALRLRSYYYDLRKRRVVAPAE